MQVEQVISLSPYPDNAFIRVRKFFNIQLIGAGS